MMQTHNIGYLIAEQQINFQAKKVTYAAFRKTTVLFTFNNKYKKYEQVGSCMVLMVDNVYYLITAGHLLNINDWPNLYLNYGGMWMGKLMGTLFSTHTKPGGDTIDFAVLKFSDDTKTEWATFDHKPIVLTDILTNHLTLKNSLYQIFGFPNSGVRENHKKKAMFLDGLHLVTESVNERLYTKHRVAQREFLLVRSSGKLFNMAGKEVIKMKVPTGISGSGLWFIPNYGEDVIKTPVHYLVGIMIENRIDKGFFQVIKIDFIIQALRLYFGVQNLPESSINIQEYITNPTLYESKVG